MTASAFTLYSKNKDRLSLLDLSGAVVQLALVTSAYAPDASVTGHSLYADLVPASNELATGNGYTNGGNALASKVSTAIAGGFKFSSSAFVWTASGTGIPAHRYVVMYVLGTLWGRVNPVIGYYQGDSTAGGTDIPLTTSGNTLTETPAAGGWFDIT